MLKLIIKYGLILFIVLSFFKFLEYQFFGYRISLETYLTIVAVAFLVIGMLSAKLVKPESTDSSAKSAPLDQQRLAQFSNREKQVLLLLGHGYTNKEIADNLGISPNTVKTHIKKLFEKLEVSNRTQAVSEAKLLKLMK